MDIPDDPSTTTTNTTDYDSGDSEGVDYVYEGQITTQRTKTARRSGRKRSPKTRTHTCAKCARATRYAEDEAEFTVFEDTDTEDEGQQHRRRPSGCGDCSGHGDRGRRKPERRTAEAKTAGRARSPYVEEYPELLPRPLIILKEHRIPGRPSVPDARRLRDSAERSLSSSRGRSPAAKRLPPRPSRLASKESSKHHEHRKHRLDRQECHKGEQTPDLNAAWDKDSDTTGQTTAPVLRLELPSPTVLAKASPRAIDMAKLAQRWHPPLLGVRHGTMPPSHNTRPRGRSRRALTWPRPSPNTKTTSTAARAKAKAKTCSTPTATLTTNIA
jgi:hypothetical protein